MKKRIMAIALVAMMIVSMSVSVFAADSPSGKKSKRHYPEVPQKLWNENKNNAPQGTPVINDPTDALITAMSAGVQENSISVGKVDKKVFTAFTKYLRSKGIKANIIATYTSVVPAGKTKVTCKSILKGCQYEVLMELVDGSVISATATNVGNGTLTYQKPAEPIVSYCIACKTVW